MGANNSPVIADSHGVLDAISPAPPRFYKQDQFNVCFVCKVPGTRLCDFCRRGLIRSREPIVRDQKIYKVRSLFSWRQTSPRGLSWLVHSLKRHDDVETWQELASWMWLEFTQPPSLTSNLRPLASASAEGEPRSSPSAAGRSSLVPIPSKNKNHALGLARALSRLTGYPILEALAISDDQRHQKTLDKIDRQTIQFERAIRSFGKEYKRIIIIDDVVTTGATTRAAFHALGRPKECEVWCLMDRRPCGG